MTLLRRSTLTLALLIGVFFLSVYLLSGSSDLKHNGDTDLRYQTTQALVDYHRLWIAHPMWKDTRTWPGRGNHLYAFYAPGQAILMVPLYVGGKVVAHHLSLPYDITTLYASRSLDLFLGAALAVLFFFTALSLTYSARSSAVLTLVFGLTTVAWPDAQSALEQTQVNLLLLLAVFAIWNFVARGMASRSWLVLAGTAAGLGVFTRYDAALFLPVLAAYPALLRWKTGARQAVAGDLLAFGSALLPWCLLILAWDYLRFGNIAQTGLHEATLGEPPWLGFLGLTISPGKGLLWYLPLVFLLPWAVARFYHRHRSLTWLFAALVVLPLLFYSNVLYWHGDPAWGPRYLYVAVPYLILPLGELLEGWQRVGRRLQLIALTLAAVSLLFQLSAISVTQWRFWYRLEAMEEQSARPFRWGAAHYHYYWTISQSPILIQLDDVYQVLRLDVLGDARFRLTARPTVCDLPTRCLSNPADNYPINTLAFWWADTRHPLLGAGTRAAIAASLAALAIGSFGLLLRRLREPDAPSGETSTGARLEPAGTTAG